MELEPDLYTGSDQKVPAPARQHWTVPVKQVPVPAWTLDSKGTRKTFPGEARGWGIPVLSLYQKIGHKIMIKLMHDFFPQIGFNNIFLKDYLLY